MPSSVLHPAQSLGALKSTLPHAATAGNMSLLFPFAFSIMFAVFHGADNVDDGRRKAGPVLFSTLPCPIIYIVYILSTDNMKQRILELPMLTPIGSLSDRAIMVSKVIQTQQQEKHGCNQSACLHICSHSPRLTCCPHCSWGVFAL